MRLLTEFARIKDNNFTYIPCKVNYWNQLAKSNPSILIKDNNVIVNFRCINYIAYTNNKDKYKQDINGWISSDNCVSYNILSYFDKNENVLSKYFKPLNIKISRNSRFNGFEDGILVEWNNKMYLCGVRPDLNVNYTKATIVIYEITENFEIGNEIIVNPEEFANTNEKHWSPVEGKPFTFIRWCNPTDIVEIDPETGNISNRIVLDKKENIGQKRGNCQTVRYNDGYLSIVHDTRRLINKNGEFTVQYRHYFIEYDNEFNITRMSNPFNFEYPEIEFCCGLQLDENDVYVSYSVFDSSSAIIKFNKSIVEELLNKTEYSENIFSNITCSNVYDLYDKAEDSLKSNQYYSAASYYSKVFNNTTDEQLENEALMKFCVCCVAVRVQKQDIFSDNNLYKFINKLLISYPSYESNYIASIYYGIMGDIDCKNYYKMQSTRYRCKFPRIKKYLKMW